ncbi:MAG: hypothetical protein IKP76_04860 [Bacilli bacterium]|nr:hypothetical protein [Bacilli bacterium]
MDIATINQEIANLNVKFATVKNLDMSDENYTVGVSVIDSLSDLIDKISETNYEVQDIPQLLGILRGPVRSLVNDLKVYEERRNNMLIGEYEINKQLELEAQKAFDDLQNNQGQSFNDFLNQPQEPNVEQVEQQVNQVEQNLERQQVMVKKLTPTLPNNNVA